MPRTQATPTQPIAATVSMVVQSAPSRTWSSSTMTLSGSSAADTRGSTARRLPTVVTTPSPAPAAIPRVIVCSPGAATPTPTIVTTVHARANEV